MDSRRHLHVAYKAIKNNEYVSNSTSNAMRNAFFLFIILLI